MKRLRRSFGGNRKEDWERRMDGFERLSEIQPTQNESSQVSINWNSSDDDEINDNGDTMTSISDRAQEEPHVGNVVNRVSSRRKLIQNHINISAVSTDNASAKEIRSDASPQYSIHTIQSPQSNAKFNINAGDKCQTSEHLRDKNQLTENLATEKANGRKRKNLESSFNICADSTVKRIEYSDTVANENCTVPYGRNRKCFDLVDLPSEQTAVFVKSNRRLQIENKESEFQKKNSGVIMSNLDSDSFNPANNEVDDVKNLVYSDYEQIKSTPRSIDATNLVSREIRGIDKYSSTGTALKPCNTNIERFPSSLEGNPTIVSRGRNNSGSVKRVIAILENDSEKLESEIDIEFVQSQSESPLCSKEKNENAENLTPSIESASSQVIGTFSSDTANVEIHTDCIEPGCDICQILKSEKGTRNVHQSPNISQTCSLKDGIVEDGAMGTRKDKVLASAWAKTVQENLVVTPQKSNNDGSGLDNQAEIAECGDSAKKKKHRFVRDGLADRLQRLIAREKSTYAIWSHKQSNQAKQDRDRPLLVRVECVNIKAGVAECKCTVVEEPDKGSPNSVVSNLHPDKKNLIVLFNDVMATKFKPGVLIQIYPPWQRLYMPNGKACILCTYFSRIADYDDIPEIKKRWQRIAIWQCSCVLDHEVSFRRCPSYLTPTLPAFQGSFQDAENSKTKSVESFRPCGKRSEALYTKQNTREKYAECKDNSILNGIETSLGQAVSFTAFVQRVFDRRIKRKLGNGSSDCWQGFHSLILQDCQHNLCELQIPSHCGEQQQWRFLLQEGLGHVYNFSGLRSGQRTNRAKNSSLFTLLDSIWTSSRGDSQQQCPGFCYIFKAVHGESSYTPSTLNMQKTLRNTPTPSCTLTEAKAISNGRCSLDVRAVYLHTEKHESFLYVHDDSSPVTTIFVDNQQRIAEALSQHVNHMLHISDVLAKNGKLCLDSYSNIVEKDDTFKDTSDRCDVSRFHKNARNYEMILLKGTITGVDENESYSWLSCPTCEGDTLSGGSASNPFLVCTSCKLSTSEPITNMRMVVHVLCKDEGDEQNTVHVQLLRKTIDSLLPSISSEDGHDAEVVLGRDIGPILCLVLAENLQSRAQLLEIDSFKV